MNIQTVKAEIREKCDALFDSVEDDKLYEFLCQYAGQRIQESSMTVKCQRRDK